MAKYKSYPEYKDSGVEWLGEIPIRWKTNALKNICIIINGSTPKSGVEEFWDGEINWITPADLSQKSGKTVTESARKITLAGLNSCGTTLVSCDSVIISTRAPIGSLAITSIESCTNQGCKSLATNDASLSKYIYYFLSIITSPLNILGKGSTFLELSTEDLSTVRVPLPNGEINEIINFLDHETAKIDNLIEKQQQLIELLSEKRQAVISHAVTKGLHPDVPMKDSGIEWLGEIPKHWQYTKIKHIAILTPKKSSIRFKYNDKCTFIPMEKLKRNSLFTDENKFINKVINSYTYFENNDLLLAKVTPCFENRNIAIAYGLTNGIGFGSTEIYVLRPTKKIRANYLLYRLQEDNFMRAATSAMTGAGGLKRVPSEFLLNYPIAIPPKSEMDEIVESLSQQESHYNLLEVNAIQGIQLLQERRTALISAAVTGKIDVRNWVAPASETETLVEEEVSA